MASARFPALSVAATLAFHTGTAFASSRLVSRPGEYEVWEVAVGVAGFVYSLLLPMALCAHPYLRVGRAFQRYDVAGWLSERSVPSWAMRVAPRGAIYSVETRRAFGAHVSGLSAEPTQVWWSSLGTWTPLLLLVAGLFHPSTVVECQVLLVCLGAAFCVLAALVVWRVPHRSDAASWLDGTSRALVGCVLFSMAASLVAGGASDSGAATAVVVFGMLVAVVAILRLLLAVSSLVFDWVMARDDVPLRTVWVHEVGGRGKSTERFDINGEGLLTLAMLRDTEGDQQDTEAPADDTALTWANPASFDGTDDDVSLDGDSPPSSSEATPSQPTMTSNTLSASTSSSSSTERYLTSGSTPPSLSDERSQSTPSRTSSTISSDNL